MLSAERNTMTRRNQTTEQTDPGFAWVAALETFKFQFTAAGRTREEAMSGLAATLAQHGREYRLEPGWETSWLEGVRIMRIPMGKGLRDGEPIRTLSETTNGGLVVQ
jgi:hypothetical protein